MTTQRNCTRLCEIDQLRRKNQLLQEQLQIKTQTIEDLNFQLRNIKKQQSIWEHLERNDVKNDQSKENMRIMQQNQKLLNQVSSMVAQSQFKDMTIRELKQKIADMRYNNEQLKKLNKKSEYIYQREVQILKNNSNSYNPAYIQQINRLKEQKEKLQIKMSKCAEIVKETEQFYLQEVKQLKNQLSEQKKQIIRLQDELYQKNRNIQSMRKGQSCRNFEILSKDESERHNDKTTAKPINNFKIDKEEFMQFSNISHINCSKWRQSDIEDLIDKQNLQKKWQLTISQMKERYERQINQLKDNIKFLILKLESIQSSNPSKNYSQNNILGTSLAQSKIMMMSASSNADSFRFTPNNSFSSSIKQSLSRRQSGNMKTPLKNKSNRLSGNHIGFLLDRTNI